jgi:Fic family protein
MRTVYFDVDDKTKEVENLIEENKELARQFHERLEISWIFHENALEGVVLDIFDLKAALDNASLEDGVLIPMYQRIRNHRNTIDSIKKSAIPTSRMPSLSLIKNLHVMMCHGLSDCQGGVFRKEMPIHRSYFHEIIPPKKIAVEMNQMIKDMKTKEFKQYHPSRQAAEVHFRLMNIFPFEAETGKVARLIMNYMVLRAGYLPVVIPDIERQRYYESLRTSPKQLHSLVVDCMERTLNLSLKFFKEGGREIW